MRADAERLLAPQFAEVVRLTTQPFMQAILDLETPRMALGGRVAILGRCRFRGPSSCRHGRDQGRGRCGGLGRRLAGDARRLPAALATFERERRLLTAPP